jgi:5-methylcytosine-specific restriction endonuclease McrA
MPSKEAKAKYRETHREQIRARARQSRLTRLEEMREKDRRCWHRNATKYKAAARARYHRNLEESRAKTRDYARQWRIDHPEQARQAVRRSYAKNPAPKKAASRRWQIENPLVVRANNAAQRAIRKNAIGRFTREDVDRLFDQQKGRCVVCRSPLERFHVDHVIPLSAGGSNWPANIQLLCPSCNVSKGAKHSVEFM